MQKKRIFLIGALALALGGSLTGAANASDASDDPAHVSTVNDSACKAPGIIVREKDGKITDIKGNKRKGGEEKGRMLTFTNEDGKSIVTKDGKVLEEGEAGIVVSREQDGKITAIKGRKILEEGKAGIVVRENDGKITAIKGRKVLKEGKACIVVRENDGKVTVIKDDKVLEEGKACVVREKDGKITVTKDDKVLEEGEAGILVGEKDGGEPAIARRQAVKVEVRNGKAVCTIEVAPAK
jgi:hypothetical protein